MTNIPEDAGIITLVSLGLVTVFGYIKKYKEVHSTIKSIYNYIISKVTGKKSTNIDLNNHPIFSEIDNYIRYKIPNVNYVCQIRKELFALILTKKFEMLRNHLREIIQISQEELNKKTKEEIQEMFEQSLLKHQSLWKEQCLNNGVFPFILDQYASEIKTTEDIYNKLITRTIMSDVIYHSNSEKIFSILTSLSIVYILLLLDMEDVFSRINGGLLNKTFNGVTCRGYEVCGICRGKHVVKG